jgi:hypothetical protein
MGAAPDDAKKDVKVLLGFTKCPDRIWVEPAPPYWLVVFASLMVAPEVVGWANTL